MSAFAIFSRRAFRSIIASLSAASLAAFGLGGCASPELHPIKGGDFKKRLFYSVIRGVQCEVRRAVNAQLADNPYELVSFLRDWSALIHLNLKFDTTVSFNPGVSLKTPMVPGHVWLGDGVQQIVGQNYGIGFGGSFSGQGVWSEDVQFYYLLDEAFLDVPDDLNLPCYQFGGLTIGGDLGLKAWLADVLEPIRKCAFVGRSREAGGDSLESIVGVENIEEIVGNAKQDPECSPDEAKRQLEHHGNLLKTLSHQVTFVITMAAGVTPVWKLVRVEAPTASPLFGATHKDTSELMITLGPPEGGVKPKKRRRGKPPAFVAAQPSQSMLFRDLSLQIGSAVRDAR